MELKTDEHSERQTLCAFWACNSGRLASVKRAEARVRRFGFASPAAAIRTTALRHSIENKVNIYRKIIEPLSNINRKQVEHLLKSIQPNPDQHNPIQSNPIQFNSIQFNSIQFNSIQSNSI